jgi:hypothetical protein
MLVVNEITLSRLEEAVIHLRGDLHKAARSLGLDLRGINALITRDESVRTRIATAQQIGWASLEGEAYRRAVEGVEVPIYQQGELVGHRTEYSDSLLSLMLKARVPGYKPDTDHTSALTVNVAVMPRASSYEEWQVHREQELTKRELTRITHEAEDAEYESVLKDIL